MHRIGTTVRARRLAGALASLCLGACAEPEGRLRVTVVDALTSGATPARIEVRGPDGEALVPADAIRLTLQCVTSPPPDWARAWVESDALDNPHTGTRQFYADQTFEITAAPGRYRLRAFKGIEHRIAAAEVEIASAQTRDVVLSLERWIDLPAAGWYGADDHIHVTRRTDADDRRISRWMQGEDLHVANLLQMGTQAQVGVTPQRAFGDEGDYGENGHWLFAGQEHPRTHFLGHTITLGARSLVDRRDAYIVYGETFREAHREGGVTGFAHFGLGPAKDGLAITAPRALVDFMEVLQFEWPEYSVWYQLLDVGIAITPTAGTDFPCGPWSVPGRERFYTRVDGPLARESWLDGIRNGRTFVTNGPLLALRADDAEIGDTLALTEPSTVRIEARVRFDPERDAPDQVEIVRNGEVIPALTERVAPGEIRIVQDVPIAEPSWLALRVQGDKVGEAPFEPWGLPDWAFEFGKNFGQGADIWGRQDFARGRALRPSAAHTAPIWVTLDGRRPGDPDLARRWIARLDDLEARLADDRIDDQTIWDWAPYSDGVSADHLRRNRAALLAAIAEARERWTAHAEESGAR